MSEVPLYLSTPADTPSTEIETGYESGNGHGLPPYGAAYTRIRTRAGDYQVKHPLGPIQAVAFRSVLVHSCQTKFLSISVVRFRAKRGQLEPC